MSEDSKASTELVEFQGKPMYPEVAAYFEARRVAQKIHDDTYADAEYAWSKVVREVQFNWVPEANETFDSFRLRRRGGPLYDAYQAFSAATENARTILTDAVRAAREGLKTSPHPEVAWIESHALNSEQGYSEAVLRALPVSDPTELWEVKRRYNMCPEFDRLYSLAEGDGVFSGGKKLVGARQMQALRNWVSRNWGDRYASQLMEHMGPVLKEIRADADKRLEDAKAEWQGLDEAWRSERSRRGAATRAANAAMEEAQAETEVEDNTGDVEFPAFTGEIPQPHVTGTREGQTERVREEIRAHYGLVDASN